RLPLEGIVLLLLAVALPTRARRFVPWVVGPLLGVIVMVKLLDIGFFNPVDDWSYASIGVETERDTFGSTATDLTVVAAVAIVVAALALPTLAVHRLSRVVSRHRGRTLRIAGGLGATWIACWAFRAAGIASTSAVALAVNEVHAVQSGLRD